MKNKLLHKILIIIALVGIGVLLSFTNKMYNSSKIEDVIININYPETDNKTDVLITKNDIEKIINLKFDSLAGKRVDSVDIEKLETTFNNELYIESAETFVSVNKKLFININQRKPLLRVFEESGRSYIIDNKANIIPLNPKQPCKLLVCNGFIKTLSISDTNKIGANILLDSNLSNSKLKDLYELGKKITDDKFLRAQINQIYINEKSEFELIPLVGNHTVIIGTLKNIDEKLFKLKNFYFKVANKGGWSMYKSINLKFKDQVVCTKR